MIDGKFSIYFTLEGTGSVTERAIHRKDPGEVQSAFPITGVVDGWFFRQTEVSAGAYLVEGTDLWGRKVSRLGGDPDELLSLCAADAKHINDETKRAL